ncbi:hypothetical protein TSUD_142590 [Trifolium subterraneum]|uniref:Transposase (putative) gypsy type domain-containing protein n=1 Tax=Trifolium subterraneum TaxID=3900 RepID=A0A2Z6LX24_TRISU|nr:hypothetical protein TSUD_142590 [Trifolium subterraneum]
MEISSRFTSDEFVSTFKQAVQVSGEGGENRVIIDPVAEGEFVTTVNEQEPHYFCMYTHVLQTLNLWLPFNPFECQILRVLNVAPCELHPNSWALLKAFQIACEGLDLVPTAEIFFCFFHVKNVSPHSLVSISSQPNKGNRLFPFYWSSSPRLIKGTQVSTLNEYERDAVVALSRFHVMSSGELVARENKPQSLGEYMASMSTLSAQQRAALVLKVRAEKAEAAIAIASADAMAQLVVEEGGVKGTKRKNQEESSRISLEIPKKKKQLITIEQEEEDADDQPLKFKRVPRSKSSVPPNSGEGASNTCGPGSSHSGCHDTIEARNKMESADNGLSALEKEFAAAKSKFEEDLATVKARQDEVVKAAVKAKDDEVAILKERVKTLEGELDVATKEKDQATTQRDEASLNVEALTARIESLELEGASQFDDGFRFALDQVKVAFPDVDVVKLGELDSVNQIVDGNIVAYVPLASE